ncbi:MAG: hypothetical protein LUH01_11815 [Parabacteroides gordonii]|nr:hypothetical protein [Parabacteroides gordonii]
MRSKKNTYLLLTILSITCVFSPMAWGQTKTATPTDYYKDYAQYKYTITNKTKTKWHYLRDMAGLQVDEGKDKFDKTKTFTVTVDESGKQIQPSHILIDTIYVHKGTKFKLSLPDRLGDNYSIRSYQRWYNLRTGKTFEVGNDGVAIGTDELVKDLLYPTKGEKISGLKPVRFINGYVGCPLSRTVAQVYVPALDMYFYYPTEEQFEKFPTVNPDNKEYLIACDVSGYTDYADGFIKGSEMLFGGSKGNGPFIEPTLSHRIIYCIRAIENENDWRHKFFEEQKSKSEAEAKYLEEYEITMPATRIPDKTQEMVCIATAANAYAVPVDKDKNDLTVTLIDGIGSSNQSGIQLCDATGKTSASLTLKEPSRIIHFKYPGSPDKNGRLSVPDGSTATILVTKMIDGITYRIARFRLTFNKSSVLLTQSQIDQIDNPTGTSETKTDASLTEYAYRTPNYLEGHYTFVTGLDFDFDPTIAKQYGQEHVYPYPLGWSESSYGFYDGSVKESSRSNKDFMGGDSKIPQWGYYAILNDYVENTNKDWEAGILMPCPPDLVNRDGNKSTFHLYVDASDQPGIIARLTFDHPLCPGSELFVSAWVKVAQLYHTGMPVSSDNAAMLFTIMGVTEGEKEKDIRYTPIYRYQTGQIPGTYSTKEHPDIPGFGDRNEWPHVYFSFTNTSALHHNYDSYVLQIDNNSASTAGADMYIDDIRIYIAPPKVEVKQKSPTCHANNVDALLQMTLDWDRLLSRLGVEKQTTKPADGVVKAHVSFCFVDSAKYIARYKALGNTTTDDQLKQAFEESIVKLSYPIQEKDGKTQTVKFDFGKLLFSPYYQDEENKVYNPDITNTQSNTITTADDAGHFYRQKEGLGSALVADIHCALEPFRTYFLILEKNHGDTHEEGDGSYIPQLERFQYYYNEPLAVNSCVAKTSFQLEAQNSIKVNGVLSEKADHTFCNGQIVNFGV